MFRPVMKKTSSTVDQVTSNIDIYMKDNNFEDDPNFEDNLGCATDMPIMKTTRLISIVSKPIEIVIMVVVVFVVVVIVVAVIIVACVHCPSVDIRGKCSNNWV